MTDVKQNGGIVNPTPNAQGQGATPQQGQAAQGTPAQQGAQGGQPANQDQHKMVPITALHEEREKRQELQNEVQTLKEMVQGMQNYQQPQQPQQQMYNPQYPAVGPSGIPQGYGGAMQSTSVQQQLEDLWEQDSRKGFQVEMGAALNMRDYVENEIENQVDEASEKFKDFNSYERPIRRHLRTLPLEQRGTKGIINAAYWMFKGRNADTVSQQQAQQMAQRSQNAQAAAGAVGGSYGTPAPNDAPTLNAQELAVAEAMGITPAEYLQNRKQA